MAPGNRKMILGQHPLWRGDKGGTGMDGICPVTYTGVCGRRLHTGSGNSVGGVAVSPADGTFQAIPHSTASWDIYSRAWAPRSERSLQAHLCQG